MKKVVEIYNCDLCGKEGEVLRINYPVVFTTDQTEGRMTKPYIETRYSLDLCEDCLNKVLAITACGAQGHNKFEFKPDHEAYRISIKNEKRNKE